MNHRTILQAKIKESVLAVIPIALMVSVMCFVVVPVPTDLMLSFLLGAVLLIVGMGLFTLGAEHSVTPIGSKVGSALTQSRKLGVILAVSFVLGLAITVAEPDLQVLAAIVPHIDNLTLVATVGIGVGLFLAAGMLRMFLGAGLRWVLLFFYAAVFLLAFFSDADFLPLAFDAGGVTTGPMTVPFIMALGVGVANIRSDRNAESDSFGLIALCSIGPILAVLILGFLYRGEGTGAAEAVLSHADTVALGRSYLAAVPHYLRETATALAPIALILLAFQFLVFRMSARAFAKVCVGIGYTYAGLVLFLTGVNVGFAPLGTVLGARLAGLSANYLMVPLSMAMGWFVVAAEPAVHVLEKQVEEISSGAISARAMRLGLSAAIALALGLAMVRVLTGVSVLWFLLPGYAAAFALSFFVPHIFTAIAFDSGGVASGPMTATFLLPLAMGASSAVGGNVTADAFGLLAMVAMMPLITIQIMGAVYRVKLGRAVPDAAPYGDLEIIELWG